MKQCIVAHCPNMTENEVCAPCYHYLRGHGIHPTLIRPNRDLVPRLAHICRALNVDRLRPFAIKALAKLIDELERPCS